LFAVPSGGRVFFFRENSQILKKEIAEGERIFCLLRFRHEKKCRVEWLVEEKIRFLLGAGKMGTLGGMAKKTTRH
jgi:hypothetical protein